MRGNSVKVSAIDQLTGREVAIVGPANGGREALGRVAAANLASREVPISWPWNTSPDESPDAANPDEQAMLPTRFENDRSWDERSP